MTHAALTDDHLDRELITLLDHALGLQAGRFTPEQRAALRERVGTMGLDEHVVRRCSAAVQGVLLDEEPHVNRDGGRVGDTAGEEPGERDGTTIAEGSARGSGTPTL